jgi:cytochrome c-type biogenesis protein CcmF
MTSWLSREAFFLVNNVLFMGILFMCFWGVNYPLISELFTGQKVTFGPPFFESTTGPLFAGLLLLMGIAPLTAWGHSTWKTLGKAIWKPSIVSLAAPAFAFYEGITSPIPVLAFWLCGFVASVTIYEYARATWARHRATHEIVPVALVHMAAKNRRRYGGYITHLGVVLMALGVIGINMFQTSTQGTIAQGQSLTLDNYTITYKDFAQWDTNDGRNIARAVLAVSKNGQPVGEIYPRRDFFYESQQPMTIPGLRSTPQDDLYVVLVDWQDISSNGATFKIFHNPLVSWLWWGAFVFMFGTILAAWPDRERQPSRVTVKETTVVPTQA